MRFQYEVEFDGIGFCKLWHLKQFDWVTVILDEKIILQVTVNLPLFLLVKTTIKYL